ncbi:MAG: AmmeMemoRadiSam system protein A [Anaerolineales bacterium]|nr:AmmeMemoRadiSam system protein A [Anaerolineales bacterium]
MREETDKLQLTSTQCEHLLRIARLALTAHFGLRPFPETPPNDPVLWQQIGLFITLWQHDGTAAPAYWPQGHLRGCVGHIQSELPLHEAVAQTAVEAALNDPRFPPLTATELPTVHIEISLLSPLHAIKTLTEINIGQHGLLITNGVQQGLLLPQVAANRQWDRARFLQGVCQKAGLPLTAWPRSAKLFAFTTVEFEENHPNP